MFILVNLSPVRIFGDGNRPSSTALIIGRRAVLTCEHSLKVSKQLNEEATAVNESYEMDYWIQEKTKLGPRGGYSPDGRINVRLYKCNQENDWALLYRVSGFFTDEEIVSIDTSAIGMTEDEFFNTIRAMNGSVVHCPVRHIQNTTFANEFTLVAFKSDITVQSASFRHIHFSGHEMTNGSSGGGVIVNDKLVAMNQDRIDDFVEEEEVIPMEFCCEDGIPLPVHKVESSVRTLSEDKAHGKSIKAIAPPTKKLKSDSETVASRPASSAALNCAIILCRCKKLMEYFQKIENEEIIVP